MDGAGLVVPGAGDGDRVHVGRVQVDARLEVTDGQAQRSRAAAEVDQDGAGTGFLRGEADQELAAYAGHEDPTPEPHPDAAEVGVADDLLERLAQRSPADQRGQGGLVGGGGAQHGRLVLGEDAARGAQPIDRGGDRGRWNPSGHLP